MLDKPITHYNDFVEVLLEAGFSYGNGNADGAYSILTWNWNEEPPYETPVRWHTGESDTDPWEWRIRVLDERTDIAYAKVFAKRSGFITRAWAPHFLAVRRVGKAFAEEYADGVMSHAAKRIYETVAQYGTLPLPAIKELAGFTRTEKAAFDRAMIELQMKMYLTMCGRQQKISQKGEEYGWSSTVFCTTEAFWGADVFDEAAKMTKQQAVDDITEQLFYLNPQANAKKADKFIRG